MEVMAVQVIARKLALEFNKCSPPKPIDFVDIRVLELYHPVTKSKMFATIETFVPGEYKKCNNNAGSASRRTRAVQRLSVTAAVIVYSPLACSTQRTHRAPVVMLR